VDVSVVVVNWNSGFHLSALLSSLQPLAGELHSAVIIDNASKDGSEAVARNLSWTRLKQNRSNLGFAGGANQGIAWSDSKWVLLLNPDIIVDADAVRGLYRTVEKSEDVAIACCALRSPSGESQVEFQLRDLPTFTGVVADALFIDEIAAPFRRKRRFGSNGPIRVQQPAAAFWLLRKEAWTELGGFDERFSPAWFEDVDFCKRLHDAAWNIWYFPDWSVVHGGGCSLSAMSYPSFLRAFYGNLLKYWRKHHSRTFPLVWPVVKIGMGVRLSLGRR